jgi:tetratricopeptide (TPR) repeat protein
LLLLAAVGCVVVAVGCSDRLAEAHRLEEDGEWEAALSVYEQLLSEDPDDVAALSGSAVALMVLQRFDEAMKVQERLVAADPDDAQTRVELGFNYLNHQDRPEDAVRVLEEAANLEPIAKNLTFLAQAQLRAGDAEEAERTLRDAIETDRSYTYAYSQLFQLLERQGRQTEAEALVEEAANAGVTIADQ